jgi:hypothetical protein
MKAETADRQAIHNELERGRTTIHELVAHSIGGLVVLLVPLAMNIYKPRGMTRTRVASRAETTHERFAHVRPRYRWRGLRDQAS